MKRRKLLVGALMLGAISLTACGENGNSTISVTPTPTPVESTPSQTTTPTPTHEHTYATEWTKDATKHWHASTCGHDVKDEESAHTYGEWIVVTPSTEETKGLQKRTCSVCGYEDEKEMDLLPHTHKYEETWSVNETSHWHASTCGHDVKGEESEHSFINKVCSVCGYTIYTEGLTYKLIDNSYYKVTGLGTTKDTDIVIPSFYNGLPVKDIGDGAFSFCNRLKSVVIPNTVTNIGMFAFEECSSLTSVVIPNSVTSIGRTAFIKCIALTNVIIPNSVTKIGFNSFENCSSLTSIVIPESVTSIGGAAFLGCSRLESIVVDEKNQVYDSRENCNGIIKTSTNTLIQGCSTTIIPNSVVSIGNNAFDKCSNLTNIIIPNSVTSIGNWAFNECSSLSSIKLSNSVTSIGNWAFYGCSFTSIVIPDSVTHIIINAFANCNKLKTVFYAGSVEDWNNVENDDGNNINKKLAFYSETQPTDTSYKYWHYVDDVPTLWDENN